MTHPMAAVPGPNGGGAGVIPHEHNAPRPHCERWTQGPAPASRGFVPLPGPVSGPGSVSQDGPREKGPALHISGGALRPGAAGHVCPIVLGDPGEGEE